MNIQGSGCGRGGTGFIPDCLVAYLVTYRLVFREVDEIGCHHFCKKHIADDS